MILEIEIECFFSFGEKQVITLNPGANILVGINGSGKSNFIKAIQLLQEGVTSKDRLENLINKKWGGVLSMINSVNENASSILITYEFDREIIRSSFNGNGFDFPGNPRYEIGIHQSGISGYYFSEKIYTIHKGKRSTPFYYLDVTDGRGVISTREKSKIQLKREVFKTTELVLSQISEPDRFYPIFTLRKAIEEIVVYGYFDTTENSPIRQLSPYYSELNLLPRGENLAHLLNYFNGNQTKIYDKIIELLKNVNTNFNGLVFSTPTGSKTLLSLKEKDLNRAITVEHISDGTLRFLLLLSILYNPNRGKVICLDEPETGLHPDMINTIAKGVKYASETGSQMIIATHSPLLLNSFEIEDLKIFEKNSKNSTTVKTMSEDDFPDWEGEFIVGQMWLRGQLGGVRW